MNLLLRLFYRETGGVHYVRIGRLNIAFSLARPANRINAPHAHIRLNAPCVRLRTPDHAL